jgi:hypothetical protein
MKNEELKMTSGLGFDIRNLTLRLYLLFLKIDKTYSADFSERAYN